MLQELKLFEYEVFFRQSNTVTNILETGRPNSWLGTV